MTDRASAPGRASGLDEQVAVPAFDCLRCEGTGVPLDNEAATCGCMRKAAPGRASGAPELESLAATIAELKAGADRIAGPGLGSPETPPPTEHELRGRFVDTFTELAKRQQALDPAAAKVLYANLWTLYDDSDPDGFTPAIAPAETPQEDAAPPAPMHPRHPYDVEGSEYLPETCSHEREHRSLICRECALIGIRRLTAPSLLAASEGRVRALIAKWRKEHLHYRGMDNSGAWEPVRADTANGCADELEAALAPLAEPPKETPDSPTASTKGA